MNISTRTKKHLNLNHEQVHSRTTSLWLDGYNEAVRMDKHQKLFNCQELTRQQRLSTVAARLFAEKNGTKNFPQCLGVLAASATYKIKITTI